MIKTVKEGVEIFKRKEKELRKEIEKIDAIIANLDESDNSGQMVQRSNKIEVLSKIMGMQEVLGLSDEEIEEILKEK